MVYCSHYFAGLGIAAALLLLDSEAFLSYRSYRSNLASLRPPSASSGSDPVFLADSTGTRVAFPKGLSAPIQSLHRVGLGAVESAFVKRELDQLDTSYNKAVELYLHKRASLVVAFEGQWLGISDTGVTISASSETAVLHAMANLFPEETGHSFYSNCVGREIMESREITSTESVIDNPGAPDPQNDQETFFYQKNRLGIWMRARLSFDCSEFEEHVMKFDPGADTVGLSNEAFNLKPPGLKLEYGPRLLLKGVTGESTSARSYKNIFIEINGLISKVDVVQTPRSIVGFPILQRYECSLNVRKDPPLSMTVLDGEKSAMWP